jgi:hypothetical protein
MQKLSEPAFTKILQDALSQGAQLLVVKPPAAPLPPPRDRDEMAFIVTLCAVLGLAAREGRLLAKLMASDYQTLEELRVAIAPKRSPKSMTIFLSGLRKKLRVHGIAIKNARDIGYYLPTDAREEIHQQLAQHDANVPKRSLKTETPARAPPP